MVETSGGNKIINNTYFKEGRFLCYLYNIMAEYMITTVFCALYSFNKLYDMMMSIIGLVVGMRKGQKSEKRDKFAGNEI